MSNGNGELQEELIRHSVTREELAAQKPDNGIVRVMIGAWSGGTSTVMQSLPDLPPFWTFMRDRILVSTVTVESRWAQAVGIAVMKTVTRDWDVAGEVPLTRLQKARSRIKTLLSPRQRSALVTDYLLRDNGAWAEIVRPTSQPTGVIGLNFLTSSRCMPTGDPDIPCVYWDRLGKPHEMRDYQIMRFVDMPDGANPFGIGFCAARRAYNDIRQTAAVQRFRLEKITGNTPQSIYFITGVTDKHLKGVLLDHRQKQEAENIVAYGGVIIAPLIQREGITSVEIPIASLPDGFDLKTEIQMMSTAYANALPGVTYLDLMPMTGQRAGSSAQSQVVDDQSAQKQTHITAFEESFNEDDLYKIMPEGVTFYFKGNDLVDKERMAKVTLVFSQAAALLVEKCQISPQVVAAWLIQNEVFPPNKNPSEYNVLEAGENIGSERNDPEGMIAKTPPTPKAIASPNAPAATKTKELDNQLDLLAVKLKEYIPHDEEDEVKTEDVVRLMVESFFAGTKQVQAQTQLPAVSSGPNFHLDNVRMEMPEEMLTAIKQMREPQISVNVPAPVVNIPPAQITVNVPKQMPPNITVNSPAQPAPVVNVSVPQVTDEEKTIEVASRDANGLLERIVQRTKRTFQKNP